MPPYPNIIGVILKGEIHYDQIKHSGKFSEEQNDEWNTKLPKFTRQTTEMITGEILDKKILHDNIKFMVNLSNDFVFHDMFSIFKK